MATLSLHPASPLPPLTLHPRSPRSSDAPVWYRGARSGWHSSRNGKLPALGEGNILYAGSVLVEVELRQKSSDVIPGKPTLVLLVQFFEFISKGLLVELHLTIE